MIRYAIYAFSICLLVGGAVGWQFAASPDQTEDVRSLGGLPEVAPRPRPTRENLLTLQRERSLDHGFSPISDELRDWSDAELIAAMEASLHDPDCLIPGDPAQRVPQWLMAEWMRRDFKAALAWFEVMETGKTQELIAAAVTMYWPEEHAAEAFDYLLAHRERFKRRGWGLVMIASQEALNRGAEAATAFIRRLQDEGFEFPAGISGGRFQTGLAYPPGFDFKAFLETEEVANLPQEEHGAYGAADTILCAWHARDREAAFEWGLENSGMDALDKISGNYMVDQKENLAWLGGKFEKMPEAQQDEFRAAVIDKWVRYPQRIERLSAGVTDPGLLNDLREMAVQSVFAGEAHAAMPLLEAIEPAQRIELLKDAEMGRAFSGSNPGYDPVHHFAEAHEKLLRTKLAEWQVGQDDTEIIISRFKR